MRSKYPKPSFACLEQIKQCHQNQCTRLTVMKSAQTTSASVIDDKQKLTLSLFHSLWETKRENNMMQVYTILSNILAKILFHVYGYKVW